MASEQATELSAILARDAALRARKKELLATPTLQELKEVNAELREIAAELVEAIPDTGITYQGKTYTVTSKEVAPLKRKALDDAGVDLRAYDAEHAHIKKRICVKAK